MSATVENTAAEVIQPPVDPAATLAQTIAGITPEAYTNAEMTFGFKSKKLKDDDGKVIETIPAPPALKLKVPVPTAMGIAQALGQEGKTRDFILDIVADAIKAAVREQIDAEISPVRSQETLDINKLHLEYLASIPKSARTGGGISAEIWEEFGKDYVAVMVSQGKELGKATNAMKLLLGKLNQCKTNKQVLTFLRDQLDLWLTQTQNAEEFEACYMFLHDKAEALLKVDDAELLANL